ncbi:uncharacterized protein KRP23_11421 [Phytophthora ramorum]|uniref:uncharacterized protein n=1 Tax=Phytophthora ramorum TaxID=164328 RepID=UPI003096600A|nr:hypothetical protein KRP23_11421 [Phytophthora ramorum]
MYKSTADLLEATGQGVEDEKNLRDAILSCCPYYYELHDVMNDRASTRSLLIHTEDLDFSGSSDDGDVSVNSGSMVDVPRDRHEQSTSATIDADSVTGDMTTVAVTCSLSGQTGTGLSCKSIDDLFRRQVEGETTASQQAFTLFAAQTLNEKLFVTDTAPRYDPCAVFNHFEQPIFDRLVTFAKDPDIMERLTLQRRQQVEANRIKQQCSQQLRSIFETLRVKQAEKLEQMQTHEFETIKCQLEEALEADLQHIRQMHAALLNHERAKINAKYEEQKIVLTDKVQCMQREVMALQKKCDGVGLHLLGSPM